MQKPKYFCSCARDDSAPCSIRRCIEPLAWNIEVESIIAQTGCPLFATIPKELRDLIYEYALIDCTPVQAGQVVTSESCQQEKVASNLLLTCRAIYLETFLLPIQLNPLRLTKFYEWTCFAPRMMLPWQFANIQALDISLQQVTLEGDGLHTFLFALYGWKPEIRHKGALVAPYFEPGMPERTRIDSCGFELVPENTKADKVCIRDAFEGLSMHASFVPPTSAMRITRARPLIHLTLRIPSTSWWTWTEDPASTNALQHHLGLDPSLGDGSAELTKRPTSVRMYELATQRRAGQHPVPNPPWSHCTPGWAYIISKLPDLKRLELVLETFVEKKAQLNKVVECAKTWRFPTAGTQCELVWDGRVEESRWSKPLVENWEFQQGYWYSKSTEFEVRTIRFTRRRVQTGPA